MQAGWTNLTLSVRATSPNYRPPVWQFLLGAVLWVLAAWVVVELVT